MLTLIRTLAHAAEPADRNVVVISHDAFKTYQDIRPDGVIHAGMYQEDGTPGSICSSGSTTASGTAPSATGTTSKPGLCLTVTPGKAPDGSGWLSNGELGGIARGGERTAVLRDATGAEVFRPLLRLERPARRFDTPNMS